MKQFTEEMVEYCVSSGVMRNVMVLTSIYEAVHVVTNKRGKDGNFMKKPLAIHDHIISAQAIFRMGAPKLENTTSNRECS